MLTAISVCKTQIESRTFSADDSKDVITWLQTHKKRNIYYCVNEPVKEAYTRTKLAKKHVKCASFIHVDIDPRAGEDVEQEQKRIHKAIDEYKIKPSVVVFSGGGFNVLWRLDEPVPIADGVSDEEAISRAIDFERRNWQVELDLNGDSCRSVCQILRLVGSINRPDAGKISRGRELALACLIYASDVSYSIDAFMATPHVSTNVTSNASVSVLGDVQRVPSLRNTEITIPDELIVIIVQGYDPEEPDRWNNDRSSALYYVCCELVRLGASDEIILGIITDPHYNISDSVLDKGSGVMRYATRQVERARDNAENPILADMNRDYAVIKGFGNKTLVMVEQGKMNIQTDQLEPSFQTFGEFRKRIMNYPPVEVMAGEKVKYITAYHYWTTNKRRREYLDVTFQPGKDTPGRYNLWNGFSVQPIPGTNHKSLLDHIFENICNGVDEHYKYLISWMARVVQQPRTISEVAPVLIGERGTGKSVFTSLYSALFAPHRYIASNVSELTGQFNSHLHQCLLVVAEEAFDLRDKKHTSVLNELITAEFFGFEKKGVDRDLRKNYVHLIMTSNPDSSGGRVVPAGDHERRYCVLSVGNKKRRKSEYFGPIIKDMTKRGGLSHLLHYLMDHSLSDFDVRDFPATEALREQQENNLSYEKEWLLGKLDDGEWFTGVVWCGPVHKKDLYSSYQVFMKDVGARNVKGPRTFGRFIMQSLPGTTDRQLSGGNRPMAYIFPHLEKCRAMFDSARGWKPQWKETHVQQEMGTVSSIRGPME